VLEVVDVRASYGAVPALRGVSLTVETGSFTVLLGRNGAGKTTTLRAVTGLVRLTGGEVRLEGRRVDGGAPEDFARAGVGHVPENRGILPGLTVAENLAMGAYVRRLGRRKLRSETDELLSLFPALAGRSAQRAETLSGGEQQMLVLARALLARPRLLLVDEPSNGLAPLVTEGLYRVLRRLVDDGLTLLVVEQYVAFALGSASSVYVLEKGAVAAAGPPDRLAGNAALVDAYLSHA
jgi:branched-chain amino acid transport system ATP-binding protein